MRSIVALSMIVISSVANAETDANRIENMRWLIQHWKEFGVSKTITRNYFDEIDRKWKSYTKVEGEINCGYKDAPDEDVALPMPSITVFNWSGPTPSLRIGGHISQKIVIGETVGYVFGHATIDVWTDGRLGYFGPGYVHKYPHPDRDEFQRESKRFAEKLVDDVLQRCVMDLKDRKK